MENKANSDNRCNESDQELFKRPNLVEQKTEYEWKNSIKIEKPIRDQFEVNYQTLDEKVADDHPVREIWNFVQKLDNDIFENGIISYIGENGRPAKDRQILFTLWLYATTEGIGSARYINILVKRDDIYRWIAGGIKLNYHTISDFRSDNEKMLDELFIQCLAVIMKDLDIEVTRIGTDGTKIRAKAKRDSFYKEETVELYLDEAKKHLEEVKKQNEESVDLDKRIKAAQLRHAKENVEKCEKALETLKEIQKSKRPSEKESVKASITEPEARVMKFGGSSAFHPAYNVQCSEDLDTDLILAIEPTQDHNDSKGLEKVVPEVEKNLEELPPDWAADKGFSNHDQLDYMDKKGLNLYVPKVPGSSNSSTSTDFFKDNSTINPDEKKITCPKGYEFNAYERSNGSSGSRPFGFKRKVHFCEECPFDEKCFPEKNGKKRKEIHYTIPTQRHLDLLEKLKDRLDTSMAEEILRLRFASELVHAKIKCNFGLTQFHVQTLEKVRRELLLVAITHNIKRWMSLRRLKDLEKIQ